MKVDYDAVIRTVHDIRPLILNEERRHQIITKGVGDYVTEVDLSIQAYLQDVLRKDYPEIQFMGEEQGERHLDDDRPMWILDPIDGTSNLIFDLAHSAVSLGLYDGEKIEFGVIYNPFRDETFYAVRGRGSFLNGTPIHVQKAEGLSECLISYGTNPYARESKKQLFELVEAVSERCIDVRRFGSAALDLAYVACGRSGGYFEQNLKPWDFAAGILLVEEAGGIVTGLDGTKLSPVHPADILCGSPEVYRELRELTEEKFWKKS